jgi:hypothetical protein
MANLRTVRTDDRLLVRQGAQPVRAFVILAIPVVMVLLLLAYGANCFCPEYIGSAVGVGLTALLLDLLCPKIVAEFDRGENLLKISRKVVTPFCSRKYEYALDEVRLMESADEGPELRLQTPDGRAHHLHSPVANKKEILAAREEVSAMLAADG